MPGEIDVLVIGAGAAGLMCAIEAGKRGRSVLVIDHNRQIGRKILISGGGRCNFTNVNTQARNFLSKNPHFAKSALARYGPGDFIRLVEKHRIRYHEKKLGQLFCDDSADQVVAMLETECVEAGVRIETQRRVNELDLLEPAAQDRTHSAIPNKPRFRVQLDRGPVEAESVVVATGGLSIPKMGASDFGYRMATRFGLRVSEPRPALVPLVFSREDATRFAGLQGVSTRVRAALGGQSFEEDLLFTHGGLSGPAILQISSYWRRGDAIEVDLLPGLDFAAVLANCRASGDRTETRTILSRYLPTRLAARWFELDGPSLPACALSDRVIDRVSATLHRWRMTPSGTEGFAKAEVTAGGIDTDELSSKTMECRKVPGLYFIGEVVDVTGHLGGFNFQWAWSSGWGAGQYA